MEELSTEKIREKIKMPPELQEAYERVVLAGMKIVFNEKTENILMTQINGPGDTGEKLGKGIAGLMLLLFQESNKTIPPAVIIPAGVDLLVQTAEFLKKGNLVEVAPDDVGQGIEVMVSVLLEKFGGNVQKLTELLNSYEGA